MSLSEIFNIKDKKILITGGGGWLGRAIVKSLRDCEAEVITIGHNDLNFYDVDELDFVCRSIGANEDVDVLINNACDLSLVTGFNNRRYSELDKAAYACWQNSFKSGIYWAAAFTKFIGGQFIQDKKKGSIINISSMYGLVAPDPKLYEGNDYFNPPAYATMKAGLLGLTRYTASFWGQYGIRCNAVCPGAFPNTENMDDRDKEFLDRLSQRTCLGRVGLPKELVGAIIFLASDASSYVTGHALTVDGGWTIK